MNVPDENATMHPITLKGSPSKGDYSAAFQICHRSKARVWIPVVIIMCVVMVALIFGAAALRQYSETASNLAFIIIFFLVAFPFFVMIWGVLNDRKQERNKTGPFQPMTTVVTPSSITRVADNMRQEFEWKIFSGYRVNDTLIVLRFEQSNDFLLLTFQNLECPNQWEDLNRLVALKLPPY